MPRLEVRLYDKTMQRMLGLVPYDWVEVAQREREPGTGTIAVDARKSVVATMLQPGVRAVVVLKFDGNYTASADASWQYLYSGRLVNARGDLAGNDPVVWDIADDLQTIWQSLCWVRPDGPPDLTAASTGDTAQTIYDGVTDRSAALGTVSGLLGRYPWTLTGTTRTAPELLGELLRVNLRARMTARYGVPYFAPIDTAAGTPIPRSMWPSVRFGTWGSYAAPLMALGGVSVAAIQQGGSVGVKWSTPRTWAAALTVDSGTVTSGKWSLKDTTANDAVVGGPGEEAARAFRHLSATDLQDAAGVLLEVFRDQTGAPMPWPADVDTAHQVAMYYHLLPSVLQSNKDAFAADLQQGLQAALLANAATSGIQVTLQESGAFQYANANGYRKGDTVTIKPSRDTIAAASLTFTGRISTVTFRQDATDGFRVTPQVGEITDDPSIQTARLIRDLAAAIARRGREQ